MHYMCNIMLCFDRILYVRITNLFSLHNLHLICAVCVVAKASSTSHIKFYNIISCIIHL